LPERPCFNRLIDRSPREIDVTKKINGTGGQMPFPESSPNSIWADPPTPRGTRRKKKPLDIEWQKQKAQLESWVFLERILLLLFVSGVWVSSVMFVLQWMRFPFRRHQVAVGCITAIPPLIFGSLLVAIDSAFDISDE
jgi:hypothetical protein